MLLSPSPGDLPNPGFKPRYPALQADSLQYEPPGKPWECEMEPYCDFGSDGISSACNVGDSGLIPGLGRSPGEGNPLQYSCLENPTDGGTWWATVYGVAKSRTRLSDFTFTFNDMMLKIFSCTCQQYVISFGETSIKGHSHF